MGINMLAISQKGRKMDLGHLTRKVSKKFSQASGKIINLNLRIKIND